VIKPAFLNDDSLHVGKQSFVVWAYAVRYVSFLESVGQAPYKATCTCICGLHCITV